MRVLFQSRQTLFSAPGGDTIQVLKTVQHLRDLGCDAIVSTELQPDLSGYDLVHIFNVTRPQECYLQASNAKKQGKRIALSPIFVSYREFDQYARGGVLGTLSKWLSDAEIEWVKVLGRAVRKQEMHAGTLVLLRHGFGATVREVLRLADILLPNSVSELNRLCATFAEAQTKRSIVVPNGFDPDLFGARDIRVPPRLELYRDCILSVARIEGLKCQLQLVRAMQGLPWKLVLIGDPTPNHPHYYRRVLKAAGPNVHVIGRVAHEKLVPYYHLARVHALVSWMETTGLSSLEAAAMGKNIVITAKGDTREYFGDLAQYCDPASVESIRAALIAAYNAPPNPALRARVLQNFTWSRAAERTMQAYELVLGGRSVQPPPTVVNMM